jgi:ATP synthase protein I
MPFHRPIPNSPKPQSKSSGGIKSLVEAEKLMQIAILLPASALVGWLAGAWLGHKLNQSWLPLAGILLGGILGLIYVVRLGMYRSGPRAKPGAGDDGSNQ